MILLNFSNKVSAVVIMYMLSPACVQYLRPDVVAMEKIVTSHSGNNALHDWTLSLVANKFYLDIYIN